jgi:hypothetical protein
MQKPWAAKTLLTAQNARLDVLGLPKTGAYRAAMAAAGGVGETAQKIVLRKIQTDGENVDHTDIAQQAAVADMLPLVLPNRLNLIDEDTVAAAVALRAAPLVVTEDNVKAAVALQSALGGALPVDLLNVLAARYLNA